MRFPSAENQEISHGDVRRQRVGGLRLVTFLVAGGSPAWYRTLEHRVFELTDSTGLDYVATLRRIVHNLTQRPDLIGSHPDTIVMMSSDEWHQNTPVADWNDRFRAQIERTQEVVTRVETFDAEQLGALVRQTSGPDDGSTQLQCRRCGGHDLKITQAQTRGADEAMTNFIRCKACNKRWKM